MVSGMPLLALLSGILLSGITPIFVRLAETDPAATGFWRMVLALPLLVLVPASPAPMSRADSRRLVLGGVAYGADLAVWYWAIKLTSVVNAQLLAFSYPLWVALFLAFGRGDRLGGRTWLALALALGGGAAVIGGKLGFAVPDRGAAGYLGDGFGLLAALFYAVTLLAQSDARQRVDSRRVLLLTSLAAAAVLLPVALLDKGPFVPATASGWLLLAAFSASAQLGQLLVVHALGRLRVTFAAVTGGLYIAVGAVAAWVTLGEALGPMQLAGMVAVVAGVSLAERQRPAEA